MSFAEAVGSCFRNYAAFSGRARRAEYWRFLLFVVLAGALAALLDALIFGGGLVAERTTGAEGGAVVFWARASGGPLAALVSLATVLPLLAVGWRRMHDVGRSGWWVLASAVGALIGGLLGLPAAFLSPVLAAAFPFLLGVAGSLYSLWLLTRPSERGPNGYGAEPVR